MLLSVSPESDLRFDALRSGSAGLITFTVFRGAARFITASLSIHCG